MYDRIINLEQQLTDLLPDSRKAPTPELLAAAHNWSATVWEQAIAEGLVKLTDEQRADGLRLAQRPVFITGVHRSGTTLMRDLLDSHPQLCVLPSEGTFLTNLRQKLLPLPANSRAEFLCTEWLRRLANPINQPPYWLLGHTTSNGSPYVAFVRAFNAWYDVLAKESPQNIFWPHLAVVLAYATVTGDLKADFWVDKTPTQERFMEQTVQYFPAVRFIHVIRNPADVLASRKQMEPNVNIRQCLQDMAHSYRLATEKTSTGNFSVIRYEDLCGDSNTSLTTLCRLLDIETSSVLFQTTVNGKPASVNSSFKADLPTGGIISERATSLSKLSDFENALLSAYVRKAAERTGYPLPDIALMKKAAVIARLFLNRL